jgi:hypothetical protein
MWQGNPYPQSFYKGGEVNIDKFFSQEKKEIYHLIHKLNRLRGIKLYYDYTELKEITLHNKMFFDIFKENLKFIFNEIYFIHVDLSSRMINSTECKFFAENFVPLQNFYKEVLDNIVIIQCTLYCKLYVYTKMYYWYNSLEMTSDKNNINPLIFYSKAWEFQKESIKNIYPSLIYYKTNIDLYMIKTFTKEECIDHIISKLYTKSAIKNIPPLNEFFLKLKVNFIWHDFYDFPANCSKEKLNYLIFYEQLKNLNSFYLETSKFKDCSTHNNKDLWIKVFVPNINKIYKNKVDEINLQIHE